jgi:hypothetical protein
VTEIPRSIVRARRFAGLLLALATGLVITGIVLTVLHYDPAAPSASILPHWLLPHSLQPHALPR